MRKILFLLIGIAALTSCSKTNTIPDGISAYGLHYTEIKASSVPCAGERWYTIAGIKGGAANLTLDFFVDTLATGIQVVIDINKYNQGWQFSQSKLINVTYSNGILNADWDGGHIRNVYIKEL